jgi:thymidylate synthase ThyX
MIEAKVIEDSISKQGKRLTTLQVKFHRFILPEFNTHRVFSRNFSSSRAIPTAKLIEQVRTNPALPVHWGQNQAGMQAKEELTGLSLDYAIITWNIAAGLAADQAEIMSQSGAHKQIVNRLLEPFMWVTGIVSSTEWDNFFSLRAHADAQPEIQDLAVKIRKAMSNSTPKKLSYGDWHLPYVSEEERNDGFFKIEANKSLLQKISAARCCRVSYLKHDGSVPNIDDDLELFQRLAGAVPIHASPLEHQAVPDDAHWGDGGYTFLGYKHKHLHNNFDGWIQYRAMWEKDFL